MRVMLDTNIFISMIFFPSAQTRELIRRLTDRYQIVVCDYVIEELRLVVERKFPAKRRFIDNFFMELPSVCYSAHVQNIGWQNDVMDGALSGTQDQCKRIEAICIQLKNNKIDGGVEYRSHVQNYGWQNFVSN